MSTGQFYYNFLRLMQLNEVLSAIWLDFLDQTYSHNLMQEKVDYSKVNVDGLAAVCSVASIKVESLV